MTNAPKATARPWRAEGPTIDHVNGGYSYRIVDERGRWVGDIRAAGDAMLVVDSANTFDKAREALHQLIHLAEEYAGDHGAGAYGAIKLSCQEARQVLEEMDKE